MKCGAGEEWKRLVGPTYGNNVLQRVKEERFILQKIQRRKANWIGHILRRNCLLKQHVIEGKIEGKISDRKKQQQKKKKT